MTNKDQKPSTSASDKNSSDPKAKKAKKPKKPQGPIRFEAIIPIALVLGLIFGYCYFFLDSHIRWAAEMGLSRVYGAEINIGHVRLSFTEPSLTIGEIQVTDKDEPALNAIAIGSIKFALSWDALLRAKLLIRESSINGIALASPRKRPGHVYPPAPPSASNGPSLTSQISDQLNKEAEAQLNGNIFGSIVNVMQGSDAKEQLEQLKDQLQSEQKIKEIEATLKQKEAEWKKRIDGLPKGSELQAIAKEIKSTKIDASKPVEAKGKIDKLKGQVKKAEDIIESFNKGQKDLQSDIGGFDAMIKEIEAAIEKDILDLQNKFQIPTIETDHLTKALFTRLLGDKLTKVTTYVDTAKKYMPERKTAEERAAKPEFVPHPRGQGRSYKFPITVSYPLFWLQKAAISSKSTEGGFSGDFSGQILDLTSDSAHINRPTIIEIAGSAVEQKIRELNFKLVMDFRGAEAVSQLDLTVGSHPFPEQRFVKSDDISFALAEAEAQAKVSAGFTGETISAQINETIKAPKFLTDAKAPILKEALEKITAKISVLTMGVSMSGSYSSPSFGLRSNLGEELGRGLKEHLKAKIEEAKAKLRKFVEDKVGAERAKVLAQFNGAKAEYTKVLESKKDELLAKRKEIEASYKDKAKGGATKIQDDLKEKAKDQLKKFKF